MGASQNQALRFLFPLSPPPLCLDSSFCVGLLTFRQIPNSSQVHKPQLCVSACPLETSTVPVGILNSAYLKSDSFAKIIKWSYFRKVALFSLFLPDQNHGSVARPLCPVELRGGSAPWTSGCLDQSPLIPAPLLILTHFYSDGIWFILL